MTSILRRPPAALRHLRDIVRRHRQTRTRGQSLVEFALLLPIFLLFVSACLDLGRVFYANISLNNAAREGAMEAASEDGTFVQNGACDPVNNSVVCRIQLETKNTMVSIAPTDITMSCSVVGCPRAGGSTATVSVHGTFKLLTPLLSVVFGGQTLNLTSSATAQLEYLPQIATVTPPPTPAAEFTWAPSSITAGDTVLFDSTTSTGDPTGWQWDFDGDGVVDSTAQNPSHVYGTAGSYTVTLTVINLTGVSNRQHTLTVNPVAAPSSSASAAPSASPSPAPCTYPPNVIGQAPGTASANLINAGFGVLSYGDLTNGGKNKIQAQNPDHTTCLAPGTTITIHYRPG